MKADHEITSVVLVGGPFDGEHLKVVPQAMVDLYLPVYDEKPLLYAYRPQMTLSPNRARYERRAIYGLPTTKLAFYVFKEII